MAMKLITGPTTEPVTLDEAKLHLRVDGNADDGVIRDLIQTARVDIEMLSLHALITQTWDLFLDGFPAGGTIKLPWPPLQSVTGVYYTQEGGSEQTFVNTSYEVDTYSTPGLVRLKSTKSWPVMNVARVVNPVRVRFVCGFGDTPASVDYRARQAILLLVGHYYEHREATSTGRQAVSAVSLLPLGVDSLFWDLRARMVGF